MDGNKRTDGAQLSNAIRTQSLRSNGQILFYQLMLWICVRIHTAVWKQHSQVAWKL